MVTVDCVDPQALAAFRTGAAGYTVGSDRGEYVVSVFCVGQEMALSGAADNASTGALG
jgi:hypothetical protein